MLKFVLNRTEQWLLKSRPLKHRSYTGPNLVSLPSRSVPSYKTEKSRRTEQNTYFGLFLGLTNKAVSLPKGSQRGLSYCRVHQDVTMVHLVIETIRSCKKKYTIMKRGLKKQKNDKVYFVQCV